jgi:hypothetical protein
LGFLLEAFCFWLFDVGGLERENELLKGKCWKEIAERGK